MEQENEYPQEDAVVEEEQASEEIINEEEQEETPEPEEDKVTLSKSEFNKLNRRAIAYETIKKEKPLSKPNQEVNISPERLDRIELMQEGYSKQEVETIMELGGRKMLDNPIVQGAIQVVRQQQKSKDASTNLSSKSPVYKKYTQEDLNKLSSSEMEKLLRN